MNFYYACLPSLKSYNESTSPRSRSTRRTFKKLSDTHYSFLVFGRFSYSGMSRVRLAPKSLLRREECNRENKGSSNPRPLICVFSTTLRRVFVP